MSELKEPDLDLDRETILQVTTKRKERPAPELRLHEDMALAKGLPAYGYAPMWQTPWDQFALYRIALTGKGKVDGCVVYYGRFVEAVIKPQKSKTHVLFSARKKAKMPPGYPEWCDGEIHPFGRCELLFTSKQIMKWYEQTTQHHLDTLHYESNRLVTLMADLGQQAQSIVNRTQAVQQMFPYSILRKIDPPRKKPRD